MPPKQLATAKHEQRSEPPPRPPEPPRLSRGPSPSPKTGTTNRAPQAQPESDGGDTEQSLHLSTVAATEQLTQSAQTESTSSETTVISQKKGEERWPSAGSNSIMISASNKNGHRAVQSVEMDSVLDADGYVDVGHGQQSGSSTDGYVRMAATASVKRAVLDQPELDADGYVDVGHGQKPSSGQHITVATGPGDLMEGTVSDHLNDPDLDVNGYVDVGYQAPSKQSSEKTQLPPKRPQRKHKERAIQHNLRVDPPEPLQVFTEGGNGVDKKPAFKRTKSCESPRSPTPTHVMITKSRQGNILRKAQSHESPRSPTPTDINNSRQADRTTESAVGCEAPRSSSLTIINSRHGDLRRVKSHDSSRSPTPPNSRQSDATTETEKAVARSKALPGLPKKKSSPKHVPARPPPPVVKSKKRPKSQIVYCEYDYVDHRTPRYTPKVSQTLVYDYIDIHTPRNVAKSKTSAQQKIRLQVTNHSPPQSPG